VPPPCAGRVQLPAWYMTHNEARTTCFGSPDSKVEPRIQRETRRGPLATTARHVRLLSQRSTGSRGLPDEVMKGAPSTFSAHRTIQGSDGLDIGFWTGLKPPCLPLLASDSDREGRFPIPIRRSRAEEARA
jgi:hypothetical protein